MTSADVILLQKLDAASLRQFELAAELSVRLIQDWLVKYKFKDWSEHGTSGKPVTLEQKRNRANEIAQALNDQARWGTHGRRINRDVLKELKLKIDPLESDPDLHRLVKEYFWFLGDLADKENLANFVHNRYFLRGKHQ